MVFSTNEDIPFPVVESPVMRWRSQDRLAFIHHDVGGDPWVVGIDIGKDAGIPRGAIIRLLSGRVDQAGALSPHSRGQYKVPAGDERNWQFAEIGSPVWELVRTVSGPPPAPAPGLVLPAVGERRITTAGDVVTIMGLARETFAAMPKHARVRVGVRRENGEEYAVYLDTVFSWRPA